MYLLFYFTYVKQNICEAHSVNVHIISRCSFCQPTALYWMFEYYNLLLIGELFKRKTCVCMRVYAALQSLHLVFWVQDMHRCFKSQE